ncbi:MAG TPA: preprotein translocase subunit SecA [Deltaproteobacteria bacterium]|nr:preprotein translocase subunit SecA [Candidatus Binatota bacterium]HIL14303.1 preprotein translocase subunit SecA [Deltaproteobacteria bacterium]
MLVDSVRKIFGTASDKYVKSMRPFVARVNELEPDMQALDEQALASISTDWRQRLDRGEELDDLLPEIFAGVREVATRVLGMRHYDVQLIGGHILHDGKIAEMKTGEGKTLVATLALVANALEGKGAHLVTVNDYLARRDADWMGRVYKYLGLSVGIVYPDMDEQERREAYRADITYGQNNEFGFDYLRDNMKFDAEEFAQRKLNFGIVDEVDSILVDEARTPLIISGPAEQSTEKYGQVNRLIPRLVKEEDYKLDEKTRSATLTEEGVTKMEGLLGVGNLYDPAEIETLHHVNQALKAHTLFKRDVDYMLQDGEVVIVDEFTGRLMPGRRWSDGLHQAVEAKEGVKIERENQTLATITFQNYFRMYDKLSGMTGTAETEAEEFGKIYGLEVLVVPTHQPMVRDDRPDVVYKTEREKFNAVIEEIRECTVDQQPVLVGTISIENSEKLSAALKKVGMKHHVLNAKHHASEAEIVSQAGRKGAVTISTNMAGRGTDIVLGGNPEFLARKDLANGEDDPQWEATLAGYTEQCAAEHEEVLAAGGLHIVGTERHESRRIDNQLRGRSGRQGDPGSSRFFMSLEDDLLRVFGAERIQGLMERMGMEDGVPIEAKMVSRAIENAQKRVEGQNFDTRKHLIEYDDVMNKQREVVYHRRRECLSEGELRTEVLGMAAAAATDLVALHANEEIETAEWELESLDDALFAQFLVRAGLADLPRDGLTVEVLETAIQQRVLAAYEKREEEMGVEVVRHLEHVLSLQCLDNHWKDHLLAMDHLKEGIGLRGYAQKNPLQEYQKEGFDMFENMMLSYENDVVEKMFSVRIADEQEVDRMEERRRDESAAVMMGRGGGEGGAPEQKQVKRTGNKVGRNDPCPCGNGKKYKKCHGKS